MLNIEDHSETRETVPLEKFYIYIGKYLTNGIIIIQIPGISKWLKIFRAQSQKL